MFVCLNICLVACAIARLFVRLFLVCAFACVLAWSFVFLFPVLFDVFVLNVSCSVLGFVVGLSLAVCSCCCFVNWCLLFAGCLVFDARRLVFEFWCLLLLTLLSVLSSLPSLLLVVDCFWVFDALGVCCWWLLSLLSRWFPCLIMCLLIC